MMCDIPITSRQSWRQHRECCIGIHTCQAHEQQHQIRCTCSRCMPLWSHYRIGCERNFFHMDPAIRRLIDNFCLCDARTVGMPGTFAEKGLCCTQTTPQTCDLTTKLHHKPQACARPIFKEMTLLVGPVRQRKLLEHHGDDVRTHLSREKCLHAMLATGMP